MIGQHEKAQSTSRKDRVTGILQIRRFGTDRFQAPRRAKDNLPADRLAASPFQGGRFGSRRQRRVAHDFRQAIHSPQIRLLRPCHARTDGEDGADYDQPPEQISQHRYLRNR